MKRQHFFTSSGFCIMDGVDNKKERKRQLKKIPTCNCKRGFHSNNLFD